MIPQNPFSCDGKWYKGNLHTHTTGSDGDKSPEETCNIYRKKGYDFLAITDHGKVTDTSGLSKRGFLVLPGSELTASGDELGQGYHIVAINIDTVPTKLPGGISECIEAIRQQGGVVIMAHPYWSALLITDLLKIDGYIGIEIYNTSCGYSIAKGHSHVYWDALLARGRSIFGFATDDAHYHFNDHRPVDTCGGWIMAKAVSLGVQEVLEAICKGRFYASTGHTIEDLVVNKDTITVRSKGSTHINFIADAGRGESFTSIDRPTMDQAIYHIRGSEKYIRVECIAPDGTAAWTNPVFVRDAAADA